MDLGLVSRHGCGGRIGGMADPDAFDESGGAVTPAAAAGACRARVGAGDLLYLPAMWYHRVAQPNGDSEGKTVAVNFWYDMKFDSPVVHMQRLVKKLAGMSD